MTDSSYIDTWNSCLEIIRDNIPPASFRTWFEPIVPISLNEEVLTIGVPSEFFREYIEEHFIELLSKTLKRVIGPNVKLIYKVQLAKDCSIRYPAKVQREIKEQDLPIDPGTKIDSGAYSIPGIQRVSINPNLNTNYSFSNFIEGECNRLGRSAGIEIANHPGTTTFNPLFLYGGPGLGKTHLAQAIGVEVKERHPEKIVLYVSASSFQIQFMDATCVKNKLTDFLHFYQSVDVLIIDDVHEFADKKGTQNAFFQIFNHLHQLGKQLILTSDKPPVELQGLEQRLLSRFKWGLTARLLPPDYETRVSILKAKSFKEGINLPDDVIEYIASKISTNIRELEGALISLMANATLTNRNITLPFVQELIDSIVSVPKNDISIEKIKNTVCNYFGISNETLLSSTRKREIVQVRQIAMYLCRNLTNSSLDAIGVQLGGKNHATVLYACNTVCDLKETDRSFRQYIIDIEKQLKASN